MCWCEPRKRRYLPDDTAGKKRVLAKARQKVVAILAYDDTTLSEKQKNEEEREELRKMWDEAIQDVLDEEYRDGVEA